jgi:proteasome-associated ATPase
MAEPGTTPPYSRMLEIVERIEASMPDADAKTSSYLAALRTEIQRSIKDGSAQAEMIAQYEEAYQKLTQPANRIGVFVRFLEDGLVQVLNGDTEYVSTVDPNIDPELLNPGVRVRLSDAFAIVGLAPEVRLFLSPRFWKTGGSV